MMVTESGAKHTSHHIHIHVQNHITAEAKSRGWKGAHPCCHKSSYSFHLRWLSQCQAQLHYHIRRAFPQFQSILLFLTLMDACEPAQSSEVFKCCKAKRKGTLLTTRPKPSLHQKASGFTEKQRKLVPGCLRFVKHPLWEMTVVSEYLENLIINDVKNEWRSIDLYNI